MEEQIVFDCNGLRLEGLLSENESEKATVICHPHPLFGGDMWNPVVECITRKFMDLGYRTLRFNFRGTGKSQGTYDNGKGEKNDVAAAISHMRNLGCRIVDIAGYSFGAWVIGNLGCFEHIARMFLVSPPIALAKFNENIKMPCLHQVITGEKDDIAPPELIMDNVKKWNPDASFSVIPGADHFYYGHTSLLSSSFMDASSCQGR